MSAEESNGRGESDAGGKVTACGPNQASYSMTTTWLELPTIKGPFGAAGAARAVAMKASVTAVKTVEIRPQDGIDGIPG
jgi:hypothetical protein